MLGVLCGNNGECIEPVFKYDNKCYAIGLL